MREFQGANALTPDGVVGPMTRETFLKLLGQVATGIPIAGPPIGTQPVDLLRPLVLTVAQKHMGSVDFSVMVNGQTSSHGPRPA